MTWDSLTIFPSILTEVLGVPLTVAWHFRADNQRQARSQLPAKMEKRIKRVYGRCDEVDPRVPGLAVCGGKRGTG
jgi:hypothetical protein